MRTLIKRLTSKTLLVNESSGANEPLLKGDRKGSPIRTNLSPTSQG